MRVRHIQAEQAHEVPQVGYMTHGPFPREMLRSNVIVTNDDPPDDGGQHYPQGATVGNRFQGVRWYRCNLCSAVLREDELDDHECEEQS